MMAMRSPDAQGLVQVVGNEHDGALVFFLQVEQLVLHFRTIRGSRAEKASSMSRIPGSTASPRASPTRCCMPPLSWFG